MPHVITLLTDFGSKDSYVAQMKGVILGILPQAIIVDVTHEIPPQSLLPAARILRQSSATFPENTCHVAVVDPGVGTERRLVAVRIAGQNFVLPDNGLLTEVLDSGQVDWCVVLEAKKFWRQDVSQTFHGRDIMAPVAAHLSSGVAWEDLGSPCEVDTLVRLRDSDRSDTRAQANDFLESGGSVMVTAIDHFGNAILNLNGKLPWSVGSRVLVEAGLQRRHASIVKTYGESSHGSLVALVGSDGEWELAVVGGSAAASLGLEVGQRLKLSHFTWESE